jgi:hypothetical protein
MKLRIKGDSVRLRLTQGEVAALAKDGLVEDQVRFAPGHSLAYRIAADGEVSQLVASFDGAAIEVRIPRRAAREWCTSDTVTLAGTQLNPGGGLRIVVEKDFACLKPREDEDESDHFPHPMQNAAE